MSSNFNNLSEETKKRLHKIEQDRIAKEAQTKSKGNSERQKDINIQVRDLDPTSKLNQDLFMQNFEDYDNKNRDKKAKTKSNKKRNGDMHNQHPIGRLKS